MGKKKVEDWQIIAAFYYLEIKVKEEWEKRFGSDISFPRLFRREEVQEEAQNQFEFLMSSSGFRSRLKKLVEYDALEVVRIDDRTPFYTLKP